MNSTVGSESQEKPKSRGCFVKAGTLFFLGPAIILGSKMCHSSQQDDQDVAAVSAPTVASNGWSNLAGKWKVTFAESPMLATKTQLVFRPNGTFEALDVSSLFRSNVIDTGTWVLRGDSLEMVYSRSGRQKFNLKWLSTDSVKASPPWNPLSEAKPQTWTR